MKGNNFPEDKPEHNGIYQVVVNNKGYGLDSLAFGVWEDGRWWVSGYDETDNILEWSESIASE